MIDLNKYIGCRMKTRGGQHAFVLGNVGRCEIPFIGYVKGYTYATFWTINGYVHPTERDGFHDIISHAPPEDGYDNVWALAQLNMGNKVFHRSDYKIFFLMDENGVIYPDSLDDEIYKVDDNFILKVKSGWLPYEQKHTLSIDGKEIKITDEVWNKLKEVIK